ncbi:MAG: phage tail protein [Roseovarius sp.]|uniref:phage tail protein n=1 Tax=Roseovarius sp. TaxID=1486281 RepID=UPI0032ED6A2B
MILFIAILVACLIAPNPASADPITSAFITFFTGVGIASTVATAIATFLTNAIIGIALTLAAQLLAEKPKVKQRGIQTEQTTAGDTTPQKFVVGRYAVEGHAVAPAYSRHDQNRILTYVLEVSNIPVEGLTGRICIDGQWTDLEPNDPENPDDLYKMVDLGVDVGGNPNGYLWFRDGTQTTAHFKLVGAYSGRSKRPWSEDHILHGTAYAVLEFLFDPNVYSGFPSVRFEVDGIRLYDPRKDSTQSGGSGSHRWNDPDTWEFTRNPMVINYNIFRGITLPTGDIYGGQVPEEDLPLDSWFAAMNECDETIGGRPKYQAGFEIDVSVEPVEIIKEMNKACFAQISEFGGVFRPRVGAPAAPVMSLTDGDLIITQPSDMNPFPGLAQTNNAITGTYIEPNDVYQGRSADAIYNEEWEEDDGGRRLTLDIGLPAVTNKSQAQHLLNSYINDNRRFLTHRMVLPPSYAALEPLDTISWTSERNGYTNKLFEVVEVEDRLSTLLQFVTLRERDANDTDWSSGDDVADPDDNTGADDRTIETVVLTATEAVVFYRNEAQTAVVLNTSVAQAEDEIRYIEIQYKKSADSDYLPLGLAELGDFVVPDLFPTTYDFRVRAISVWDAAGEWTEETDVVVDFLPDNRGLWNGRFVSGDFTGWTKEEYDGSGDGDAAVFSVVERDAASDEDALKYAPTLRVVELDLGSDPYTFEYSRLIWDGLVPVEPGRAVSYSFRHAAGDGSTYANPTPGNGGLVRMVLRWYDEDGVQLSDPDDETDDEEVPNLAPVAGTGWWKLWQATSAPPEQAAFCKPVFECSGGAGLSYLADFRLDTGIETGQLAPESVLFMSSVTFASFTAASDGVEELVVDDEAVVAEVNTGSSGEAFPVNVTATCNLEFTTQTTVTGKLYIDGVVVASIATDEPGAMALSGSRSKVAGTYDIELKATAVDASEVTLSSGTMLTLVGKR